MLEIGKTHTSTCVALRRILYRLDGGHHSSKVGRHRPGQRFATAIIGICSSLIQQDNNPTSRWVPSHLRIEGNEAEEDEWDRMAADCRTEAVAREYLRETSLAYMTRKDAEARTEGIAYWITEHVDPWRKVQTPERSKGAPGGAPPRTTGPHGWVFFWGT